MSMSEFYLEVIKEKESELQRHKRAIEWCLQHGAGRSWLPIVGDCVTNQRGQLDVPSDIADLIKGER